MKNSAIINKLENLKTLRESKHITQLKLGIDLGVSQEVISRYESGSAFPQPNRLIEIANYFNCSVDYLLGLTNITTPIKYLSSENLTSRDSELISKYNSLSLENQRNLDSYLEFLLSNKKN